MDDFVATTPDRFVEIVKEKSSADLTALRAGLPDRIKNSVIGDTVRYTRHLEQFYCEAWSHWCKSVAPLDEAGEQVAP
jgi:predicted O-linked N-acetylglucosamine transferase (SPINDLY family)